jgi:hypothetical protein
MSKVEKSKMGYLISSSMVIVAGICALHFLYEVPNAYLLFSLILLLVTQVIAYRWAFHGRK